MGTQRPGKTVSDALGSGCLGDRCDKSITLMWLSEIAGSARKCRNKSIQFRHTPVKEQMNVVDWFSTLTNAVQCVIITMRIDLLIRTKHPHF